MKIKTINKTLLVIFTFALAFLSVFALVAHIKVYSNTKPADQTELATDTNRTT